MQKTSAEVRAKLSHPVVDSDGHAIECGPVFLDYLKKVGGADVAHRYEQRLSTNNWYTMTPEERQRKRVLRPASWTLPARNTYDRATAMLPSLLCSRMDDFGIDFSVVFSTLALSFMRPSHTLQSRSWRLGLVQDGTVASYFAMLSVLTGFQHMNSVGL